MTWAWLLHKPVLDFWAYLAASGITTLIGVQLAALLYSNDEDQK
jgi:hypothetical protein